MNTELIEELFSKVVQSPREHRAEALSAANCSDEIKQTVGHLLNAHEKSSLFFNEDLVSDLQKISPGFLNKQFNSVDEQRWCDDTTLEPGQRVGNYLIEDVIGMGGVSVVYRARQVEPINRSVAIKLIRPSGATPTAMKRFLREQQVVAIMRHPNIAALYEVTQTEHGKPVAVMEFIRGCSITEFCARHQLSWKQRVSIFLKVCKGLSHAHRRGVVHRDIKPENILVTIQDRKPVPKLIDFGIALIKRSDLKNDLTLTQAGHLIGSPRYMSPEQFENCHALDHRSDMYSAAMVLFELLAGMPFREGTTANELITSSNNAEPDRLSRRLRKIASGHDKDFPQDGSPDALAKFASKDLDWVLAKALARDPENRYADVAAFSIDLRAAMLGKPVSVAAPSVVARTQRFLVRHARQIGIVGLFAVILLLGIGLGLHPGWSSTVDLQEARIEQSQQVKKTAAANDLIMALLASDEYELTSGQFDFDLVPVYRAHYQQIRASGGPQTKEDKFVYGILAVMEAMIGDFDQAESLMETADAEHGTRELRTVRNKICEKYAVAAKARLVELNAQEASFEKASQQMTLARCYFVWGMYDDGEQLLIEAIDYFEFHRPCCYESLVARLTLAKILQRSGRIDQVKSWLIQTQRQFHDQYELLSSDRGNAAWSAITQMLERLPELAIDT